MGDCICGRELDERGDCYACDDPDGWPEGDDAECSRCHGTGEFVSCPDDMCHGQDFCIHGDDSTCPSCGGSGYVATPEPSATDTEAPHG